MKSNLLVFDVKLHFLEWMVENLPRMCIIISPDVFLQSKQSADMTKFRVVVSLMQEFLALKNTQ